MPAEHILYVKNTDFMKKYENIFISLLTESKKSV